MSLFRKFLQRDAVEKKSESAVVADALSGAEWIIQAMNASGYKVSYEIADVSELDRFFDEQAPGGAAAPGGLLAEDLGTRIFAIGALLGETIRRHVVGRLDRR